MSRSNSPKTPEPFLVKLYTSFQAGGGGLKQLTDFTASAV